MFYILNPRRSKQFNRAQTLKPTLEKEYASVKATAISRHMWAHAEQMNFKYKNKMHAWIRSNWKVSIVSTSNVITPKDEDDV